MKDRRILYVSSEVLPYLPETQVSSLSYETPRLVNSLGGQIRIFMPRFGNINERRHQLHEVIRLSGMNLVVNDMDMPLIIKVASIPRERIQVYFIDNDEYFKRKATFTDEEGNFFKDNDERAIFFAKGVIETVKKLNWSPDLIHVHGWMSAIFPLYLKEYYHDEPLFADSKIVTSLYQEEIGGQLNSDFIKKINFDGIDLSKLKHLEKPGFEGLMKTVIDYSDALVFGSEELNTEVVEYAKKTKKPILDYQQADTFADAFKAFYLELISNA